MAVNFPTDLATPAGSTHTLIDLNNNKVKGIGFFDTLGDAQSLNENQRCLGYLAVISNGTDAGVLYQFTGTSTGTWASSDSWTLVGSASTNDAGAAKVLHHNLSTRVMLSQTQLTVNGSSYSKINPNPTSNTNIASELELRFEGDTTLGYDVSNGGTPLSTDPEFVRDLADVAANRFTQTDTDFNISSCFVTATATLGDPYHYFDVGLAEGDLTALQGANWAADSDIVNAIDPYYGVIAQNSQAPPTTSAADLAFMPIIPVRAHNGTLYWLHYNAPIAGPIPFATFTDSDNWSSVWSAGDPHIGVYAWLYENGVVNQEIYAGGQSPSINTATTGANVGATGNVPVNQRINTLAQLKERLRIKLKLTNAARAAIAETISNTANPSTWKDAYLKVDVGITITQ